MLTTDVGDFLFIQANDLGGIREVRKVDARHSAGSRIWYGGKIISRNNGSVLVFPYIRNSDGKRVMGHTKGKPGEVVERYKDAVDISWGGQNATDLGS